MNKKELLNKMVNKQKHEIDPQYHLKYSDLVRISSKISSDFIDCDNCCLWEGYVTNLTNPKKGRYINFYFNKRKMPLHRLIYNNFKDNLSKGEYLKFSCKNKGYCLNINHMDKVYNNVPLSENSIKKIDLFKNMSTKVSFD